MDHRFEPLLGIVTEVCARIAVAEDGVGGWPMENDDLGVCDAEDKPLRFFLGRRYA